MKFLFLLFLVIFFFIYEIAYVNKKTKIISKNKILKFSNSANKTLIFRMSEV